MDDLKGRKPRYLAKRIEEALTRHPVVVVTGARQTGKTTLVRTLLAGPTREYLSLDDFDVLERAESDPFALLASSKPLTVDEIQRSPKLLLAIKREVDVSRRPGRFLLTGSANFALLREVSESLAGRAVYITLWPFSEAERLGLGRAGFWEELFQNPQRWEGTQFPVVCNDLWLMSSGFPPAALGPDADFQWEWLEGYVRTYLERDLQQFTAIDRLADFRRFMRLAALRGGKILNLAELARDAGIPQATAHRWLNLLEASYLALRLPALAVNRSKRLLKAPKFFLCDPGLTAFLAGFHRERPLAGEVAGALLETKVLAELLAWREGVVPQPEILYWRTASGTEVDFVVEWQGKLWPLEVKLTARPRPRDWAGLAAFLAEYPDLAPFGLLLHAGNKCQRLAARVWGVPLALALGVAEGQP
ncbi:ATP-binding protein [Thermoanaerobaculum aquaticum]|uniref:ATP-binding protein n=1 Tax=Thermoanaerobaculum aquaticum TaxID=1312852 RepID=UPI000CB01F99|nr:ATP-binding protein [Thermoanaerobaculum aquaticum]BCW92796.1 MAG: hypothetical protein KatS3mg007_0690 [Thermoanaerobaculum sp.]GBC80315.1 hypothetical protein HRbin09_01550 [bacterium HR09]